MSGQKNLTEESRYIAAMMQIKAAKLSLMRLVESLNFIANRDSAARIYFEGILNCLTMVENFIRRSAKKQGMKICETTIDGVLKRMQSLKRPEKKMSGRQARKK